ncbi:hypothetical protein ES705_43574 [subsurface metagenome]
MRETFITEFNLVSVKVIDDVIEICMRNKYDGPTLLKITQGAWNKVCERVIDDMDEGVSLGEEV